MSRASEVSELGPELKLRFQLVPAFKMLRSEFNPKGAFQNITENRLHVLSNEEGYDARGEQYLKWNPTRDRQAAFKAWILACVRIKRLAACGKTTLEEWCVLSGSRKTPASILAGVLYKADVSDYEWIKRFCGVTRVKASKVTKEGGREESCNEYPTLGRYFRVRDYKSVPKPVKKRTPTVNIGIKQVRIMYRCEQPPLKIFVEVMDGANTRPATDDELIQIEYQLLCLPEWDKKWAQEQAEALKKYMVGTGSGLAVLHSEFPVSFEKEGNYLLFGTRNPNGVFVDDNKYVEGGYFWFQLDGYFMALSTDIELLEFDCQYHVAKQALLNLESELKLDDSVLPLRGEKTLRKPHFFPAERSGHFFFLRKVKTQRPRCPVDCENGAIIVVIRYRPARSPAIHRDIYRLAHTANGDVLVIDHQVHASER